MNAQLAAIVEDFERAQARLRALAATLSPIEWSRRPSPGRWSPLECVAHLNLTAIAMLPLIRDGLERARRAGAPPPRYRKDLWGWLLVRGLSSPGKFKTNTQPKFVPESHRPAPEVLAEFDRLQEEQIAATREADGLAIHRVKIVSPFDPRGRVRYSVYSALSILPVHQHRHLWQAEQSRPQLSRRP